MSDDIEFNIHHGLLQSYEDILDITVDFVSTERIFEELWDYDEEPSELSLRAYVKNLRKILGKEKIINQRGRGYCYG